MGRPVLSVALIGVEPEHDESWFDVDHERRRSFDDALEPLVTLRVPLGESSQIQKVVANLTIAVGYRPDKTGP